jgi:hypothetical protein
MGRWPLIQWYAREDSNLWPLAPEASALSAELRAQVLLRPLYRSSSSGISSKPESFERASEVEFATARRLPLVGYRRAMR